MGAVTKKKGGKALSTKGSVKSGKSGKSGGKKKKGKKKAAE